MGRLEDIVARHRAPPTARTLIWAAFAILLVASVIALMFTDLAQPPHEARPPATRVDDVLLRAAPHR